MKKKELERVKNIQKSNMISRQRRMEEYRNKLRMDELEEKDRKILEFKMQKAKLAQQRNDVKKEMEFKKEEILMKVDKLMKQNKELEPKTIKEVFPEDQSLYERIETYKKNQKDEEKRIIEQLERKNTKENGAEKNENSKKESKANSKNNTVYKSGQKSQKEKDIETKVEIFKKRLQEEFDLLITQEKKKEVQRVKAYENEKDESKKQELEKKNSAERAKSTELINETKESNEEKIKEYEKKLRAEMA